MGPPHKTYVDQLKVNEDLGIDDMMNVMNDKISWKIIVIEARPSSK